MLKNDFRWLQYTHIIMHELFYLGSCHHYYVQCEHSIREYYVDYLNQKLKLLNVYFYSTQTERTKTFITLKF